MVLPLYPSQVLGAAQQPDSFRCQLSPCWLHFLLGSRHPQLGLALFRKGRMLSPRIPLSEWVLRHFGEPPLLG